MPAANPRGEAFAALLREARRRAGLTQDQLAERSGVSRSTILRWEAGGAERPDPDQVRTVALTLGVDPIHAAIALGYIAAEDVADRGRRLSPDIADVVAILEDPSVPSAQKDSWVQYLRYLRAQQAKPPADNGRQAS